MLHVCLRVLSVYPPAPRGVVRCGVVDIDYPRESCLGLVEMDGHFSHPVGVVVDMHHLRQCGVALAVFFW